jgi:hypothetical protein
MTRNELKEIIKQVLARVKEGKDEREAPRPACLYGDSPPGPTTLYGVGEES